MAAVDGLLNLLLAKGADTLTLSGGAVPELIKSGAAMPLSMPPLDPELIRRFIDEVRAAGDGTTYRFASKDGPAVFGVVIASGRIEFHRADLPAGAPAAGARGPSDPSEAPAPRPAASAGARATPARGPVDGLVERLIAEAIEAEATDLFLSTSADARMRVGMELQEVPASRVSEDLLLELARLDDARRALLESHGSVDFALEVGEARVRVNLFRHSHGLSAALRPIGRRIRSLTELGLPRELEALTDLPDGLVLLVGPTGTGKSTTLAALLEHLNQTRSRHVVTIEDPVEFEYESCRCLVHQREVGRDVESFAAGLRAALRESPDVILVGEMRDSETFAAALTAAETGHLVFSTLHSGSAPMAIDRIIDSFPPHQQPQVRGQLASALRAIVTQVLLPTVEPGGVVAATERMMMTHAIAHAIRDSRGHQISDRIQTGRADGMVSLEASLADLVRRGRITIATASATARNPDVLHGLLET
jgi:twitching motility protein PilT